ncbi:MAG: hypothetical protein M9920_09440 [Verrucomicrobiae bacterium]|nr:hypothetical protein [Verrucomicrobiae bacterium]
MSELAVRTFAAGNKHEARLLQVGDQLAYLARHMMETAISNPNLPASIHRQANALEVLAHGHHVESAPLAESGPILSFYMGKNTPERKDYIMDQLVVPVEE